MEKKPKLHIIGIPHAPTGPSEQTSAFVQKIWKLCRMMPPLGYEMIHYGIAGSEVACEHVDILSKAEWEHTYGDRTSKDFMNAPSPELAQQFNENAITAVQAGAQQGDIILFPYGQASIAKRLVNLPLQVESGIGYEATFARFKVFESRAWQHYIYAKTGVQDGPRFDAVIPNYFDPEVLPQGEHRGKYFLYMGRLIPRKGVAIAAMVAKHLGRKLLVVGQGDLATANVADTDNIEFLGPINDQKQKALLLGNALALFCPTQYFEPFGGVAVEAMMCGTPVIASNYGAFPETIIHGVTGWRAQLFDDYVWSAEHLDSFDHERIRQYAIANFSMERIARMYDSYFVRLVAAGEPEGWLQLHPERQDHDWLEFHYP